MTEPTDAEIWQMWMPMVRRMGVADPVEFARAVLAKWGTPAVAGEPFCYVSVNKQGDITRTMKRKDKWTNIPLYTTPQHTKAQAGAPQVSPEQWQALFDDQKRLVELANSRVTSNAGHSECERCRRREPGSPDHQTHMQPPAFVGGKCPQRIAT